MTKKSSNHYDVGYRKPPKHTQFQKGRSGNPAGRKRQDAAAEGNSIALFKALKAALDQKMEATERGKKIRVSVREVLIKLLINSALDKNNEKALISLLKLVEKADRADREGRAGEPMVLRILGGLPESEDEEPPPPPPVWRGGNPA